MMSDYCEPVNIGNPNEISVLEFAEIVIDIMGSKSNITYCDLPQDDPQVRRPDITRAREILGWEPKVDLQDGLEKTIEYFRGVN
jgi:dTDP-glucose 4,6-dehydratase